MKKGSIQYGWKKLKYAPLFCLSVGLLVLSAGTHATTDRFERTYTPKGAAHLTISNVNGDISVTAWEKSFISIRAVTTPPAVIEDQVNGDVFVVSVKRRIPPGSSNFQVFLPSNTAVSLSNVMGKIDVKGMSGDVSVDSFDGDIRLLALRSGSVDVKVTTGNIFFDGELREGGSYALQSFKGDIDVTLPAAASFDLNARSLNGVINLGDFVNNLTGGANLRKGVSGTHLKGGARLSLTTFTGRVFLHKTP